jgi:hypothetical protein
MFCGCGITKVHFLGTIEDWVSVKSKIKQMGEYDEPLREWSILLLKIIDKFILTMQGKVDKVFWNSIISKEMGFEYGPSDCVEESELITGWLSLLLFLH